MSYMCPVCGFPDLSEPPHVKGGGTTRDLHDLAVVQEKVEEIWKSIMVANPCSSSKSCSEVLTQITQAPTTTYVDFLNFFRSGRTIDDNVDAPAIAGTLAAAMLKSGVASGHLTKLRNWAIPEETLADISLTKSGSQLIQTTHSANWQSLKLERASLRMMANRTRMWAWSSLRTENF